MKRIIITCILLLTILTACGKVDSKEKSMGVNEVTNGASIDNSTGEGNIDYIEAGLDEPDEGKPMPCHRVAYRCPTLINSSDELVVDVFCGAEYSLHKEFGNGPTFEDYGENGYPLLTIEFEPSSGQKIVINGHDNLFERKFLKKDRK